ncbi:MAG: phasin family protein [Methylocystis silviterrae]|uniref:phasin family protein n=1 Tax=Methylocystis silviterrae TaxID=2743612 RepID=UPI003C7731AA
MATQGKTKQHRGATDAGRETPVEAPLDAHAVEAATPEPSNEGAVDVIPAPFAVIGEVVQPAQESFSVSVEFDAALWSKKSLELWSENAAAFVGLAERLAKARSFEEIVDVQSRFASERIEAFIRQSKELMEFARSLATLSAAPLCDASKKAA